MDKKIPAAGTAAVPGAPARQIYLLGCSCAEKQLVYSVGRLSGNLILNQEARITMSRQYYYSEFSFSSRFAVYYYYRKSDRASLCFDPPQTTPAS